MKDKITVAVMFGGKSPEHEVSVITGVQVLENIDKSKYLPVPIYVGKDGNWYSHQDFFKIETFKDLDKIKEKYSKEYLEPVPNQAILKASDKKFLVKNKDIKIDVIFPCFHGGLGENGGFQGFFEMLEKPYVGSGILGSIVSMDKVVMKQLFQANNINQAEYEWFYKADWLKNKKQLQTNLINKFKYPMFVKPANAGSSIGVSKVTSELELENAIEVAAEFDQKIIVEKGITNAQEINVSVIGNTGSKLETSVCEEVFASSDFLNYDDKYKAEGGKSKGMASTTRQIPAKLSPEMENKVKETAKKAFSVLNCHGLARIDFLVREKTNEVYVIELNSVPGSLSFYLWEPVGLSFKDMLDKLITLAIKKFENEQNKVTTFDSNILQNFSFGIKNSKIG